MKCLPVQRHGTRGRNAGLDEGASRGEGNGGSEMFASCPKRQDGSAGRAECAVAGGIFRERRSWKCGLLIRDPVAAVHRYSTAARPSPASYQLPMKEIRNRSDRAYRVEDALRFPGNDAGIENCVRQREEHLSFSGFRQAKNTFTPVF